MINKDFLLSEKKRIEEEQIEVLNEIRNVVNRAINQYITEGYLEDWLADADSEVISCSCDFNRLFYQRDLICEYLKKFDSDDV